MTKKQYEKMCSDLENTPMYDGRGTTDLYVCRHCGCQKLTTYKDKGVTPFSIGCACGRFLTHEKTYRGIAPTIDIEWRRPTYKEFLDLSEPMQEHVRNGGLIKIPLR